MQVFPCVSFRLQSKESAALKTHLAEPSLTVKAEVSFWKETTKNVALP